MKITTRFKRFVKPHFDVPKWVSLDEMSGNITNIVDYGKTLFIPQQASYVETFEEACKRLNLSEADLKKRRKEFIRLQILYTFFALGVAAYAYDLLLSGNFLCVIICLSLILVIFSQIFRYNFWAFQIKNRKLGCTFKDWLSQFRKGSAL